MFVVAVLGLFAPMAGAARTSRILRALVGELEVVDRGLALVFVRTERTARLKAEFRAALS